MRRASPPAPAAPATPDGDAGPGDQISLAPRKRRRRRRVTPRELLPPPPPIGVARQVAGTTGIIFSVVLLGFGLWLAVFSKPHYHRAHHPPYPGLPDQL